MKTIDKIPSSKIGRAANIIKTGAKVGGNYISHYSKKLINSDTSREELDLNNAKDIYKGLTELKGSALKVAQMLSMEKNILPQAYANEFAQAQFSVPPLSPPLVTKTFRKYLGKSPLDIFDTFNKESVRAASMGQVHQASLNNVNLAVKIQYPGVAESISSDLALIKPFAVKMLNLKGKDSDKFFEEVESKLIEETDYELELKRSIMIKEASKKLPGLIFPIYYEELSGPKILTMSWLEGIHLSEFSNKNQDKLLSNKIGQSLWDFYMYQMHELKKVQADPHPGNFLITEENNLGVIDFGCIKEIPSDFYTPYFNLTKKEILNDPITFVNHLLQLEIIHEDDSKKEKEFFTNMFHEMLTMFALPFQSETFDFGKTNFLGDLAKLGDKYSKSSDLREFNGNRGSKHLLYMNRTFFGLYSLLNELNAEVYINQYKKYLTEV
jgi:predicted unusual protein kinase regulating ubiquinone biosynthesis (AarF/ABC1/UbiB family)